MRHPRQNLPEFGKRLLGAAHTQERVGVLVEHVDVVRRERARPLETLERLLVAFEGMQHVPEIGPAVRCARIDFDGGAQQPVGFADASELRFHGAEQIKRIEIIGRGFEHARIDFLGLTQPALAMQPNGFVDQLANVEGSRLRAHERWIPGGPPAHPRRLFHYRGCRMRDNTIPPHTCAPPSVVKLRPGS